MVIDVYSNLIILNKAKDDNSTTEINLLAGEIIEYFPTPPVVDAWVQVKVWILSDFSEHANLSLVGKLAQNNFLTFIFIAMSCTNLPIVHPKILHPSILHSSMLHPSILHPPVMKFVAKW